LNYFSENERESQRKFALFRTRVSRPLLVWLDRRGCTPTEITLLSALAGLLFGLSVVLSLKAAAFFLFLHLLADSLDGSLARHQQSASEHGAFYDIITDHIALITICAVPFAPKGEMLWLFPAYGFTYVLLIALVAFGNATGTRLRFVVRTKYLFFLLAAIHVYRPIGDFWFLATQIFLAINLLVVGITSACLLRPEVRIRPFFIALMLAPIGVFIVYLAIKTGWRP
jgi:phosphatidylglycerophosphate synthase